MQAIERLKKDWNERARFRGLHANLCLSGEGLELGTRTVLAKRDRDGALEIEDERLVTLLSAALGQPVDPSVLGRIRLASKHARAGDACMAAMHVALAKLPPLADPRDAARRLFIADGLMAAGVRPRDIWTALEFDPAAFDALTKYDPSEPRNPAGDGRASGEWTSGETSAVAEDLTAVATRNARQLVEQDAPKVVEALLEDVPKVARWSGPLAFLTAFLYSTPTGGTHHEGSVPGHPDLRYSWNEDETQLVITRVVDNTVVLRATLGPDNTFFVRYKAIARLVNDHVLVDPAALPLDDPRTDQQEKRDPQQCPKPQLDKPQGTARSKAYVLFMKDEVNKPPTPPEMGYRTLNPFADGAAVYYDDCERTSGTLIEYKGPTYAEQLVNPYYGEGFREKTEAEWLDQATRQIEASGGRPVRWYFAEQPALDFASNLFNQYPILKRIKLVYAPPPENWQWK